MLGLSILLALGCGPAPLRVAPAAVIHPASAAVRVQHVDNIGGGSGVVVSQDAKRAVIMTAAHVVADPRDRSRPLQLVLVIKESVRIVGTVIYHDTSTDLAALATKPVWPGPLAFAAAKDWTGTPTRSYAYPDGKLLALFGKIVDTHRQIPCPRCGDFHLPWKNRGFILTDLDTRPGVSGSALVVEDRGQWRVLGLQQLGRRDSLGNPVPDIAWASSQEDTLAAWKAIQLVTGP